MSDICFLCFNCYETITIIIYEMLSHYLKQSFPAAWNDLGADLKPVLRDPWE